MDLPVPASEKQSVNEQMIFAIIPIIDLWAAFRVEKLRLYVAIQFGMGLMDWGVGESGGTGASIAFWIFFMIPVAVYLMRMWTIQWNAKMEIESNEEKPSIDESKID